jgi:hypothetical protein
MIGERSPDHTRVERLCGGGNPGAPFCNLHDRLRRFASGRSGARGRYG